MQTTHTRTLFSRLTLFCGLVSIVALLANPASQTSGQARQLNETTLKANLPSQARVAEEPAATPLHGLPNAEELSKYLELKTRIRSLTLEEEVLYKQLNSKLAVKRGARG